MAEKEVIEQQALVAEEEYVEDADDLFDGLDSLSEE